MLEPYVIITVGVPACGKSYYADILCNEDPEVSQWFELNLDYFRQVVSGDAADQDATIEAVKMRDLWLRNYVDENKNIVISDTNANPYHRENLLSMLIDVLGVPRQNIEILEFKVPLDLCHERNEARERKVPAWVIDRMAAMIQQDPPEVDAREFGTKYSTYTPGQGFVLTA